MNDDDRGQRTRIRNRALALGALVLFLYVGFMVLVWVKNPSLVGQ